MALKGTPMPPKDVFAGSSSSSSWFAKLMTLEVTVVSAEEVVFGDRWRRPLDHGAHAVVRTGSSEARTGVNDEKGHCNGYPYWGEAVRVTVSTHAKAIDVEIHRRQEPVAAASVPVADFSVGPPGHLHCLSYRLFDTRSGISSRNGIVNITVKRLDGAAVPRGEGKGGKTVEEAASGSGDSCCGGLADKGKAPPAAAAAPAGAVMGYPVEFSAAGQANGKGCV
ncbi:BON1-associated protein 1-like [Hordeum vulgare subsp. vulgare]|uniref:C2 domain-containing protein n=1 Tax=Hordeum vulgare subsp. vulgare TaxID=112509 RepID=A0A8I6Y0K8_HORVV|nr:BON1-associated protein 1-like [Hordeum vulgare subsp. vulgare]